MRRLVQTALMVATAMAFSSAAMAQQDDPDELEPAGLVQGVAALTTSSGASTAWSGAVGARVAGWLEVNGEAGKMRDVTPDHLRTVLRATPGVPSNAQVVRVPAYYGLVNVRLVPPRGAIRPFVNGGFGWARLDPQLDLGSQVVTLPNVFTPRRATKPMLIVGGGLRVGLGPLVAVDAGYRYMRIYSDYQVDTDLNDRILTNVGTFYAAVGFRF